MSKIDITNQKFGMLTAIMPTNERGGNGQVLWMCLCDCGKVCLKSGSQMKSGSVTTCGCHGTGAGKDKLLNYVRNRVYRMYVGSAKKRGLEFCLSRNQVLNLILKSCFYCGTKPKDHSAVSDNPYRVIAWHGIDRVDNDIGYVLDNVVPCCNACNCMKGSRPIEEFLSHIRSISAHRESNDQIRE